MQVTLVERADIPEIEGICQRAFEQMDYAKVRGYTYSRDHIVDVIERGLQSWRHILIKCSDGSRIVGFMAVEVGDFSYISVNFRRANELVWHADPVLSPLKQLHVQKALVLDMTERTTNEGATLQIATDIRFPSLARMLQKMGFAETSKIHTRRTA